MDFFFLFCSSRGHSKYYSRRLNVIILNNFAWKGNWVNTSCVCIWSCECMWVFVSVACPVYIRSEYFSYSLSLLLCFLFERMCSVHYLRIEPSNNKRTKQKKYFLFLDFSLCQMCSKSCSLYIALLHVRSVIQSNRNRT